MTTNRSADTALATYPHITERDRLLLQLLDDHQAFTTDQIHRLLIHRQPHLSATAHSSA